MFLAALKVHLLIGNPSRDHIGTDADLCAMVAELPAIWRGSYSRATDCNVRGCPVMARAHSAQSKRP